MLKVYSLTGPLSPDADIIVELVRAWRQAREHRLQFLTDLHSADEDRAYLCTVVLPNNEVYVAEVDGRVAGFIAFANGWVNHLYVAPAFQGGGVGTQLLTLATRSNSSLQLWV